MGLVGPTKTYLPEPSPSCPNKNYLPIFQHLVLLWTLIVFTFQQFSVLLYNMLLFYIWLICLITPNGLSASWGQAINYTLYFLYFVSSVTKIILIKSIARANKVAFDWWITHDSCILAFTVELQGFSEWLTCLISLSPTGLWRLQEGRDQLYFCSLFVVSWIVFPPNSFLPRTSQYGLIWEIGYLEIYLR